VVALFAQSPGDKGPDLRYYTRDSLVVIDMIATNEPGHLNKGLGYTVPRIADEIKAMCARWEVKPIGVIDVRAVIQSSVACHLKVQFRC